MTKQSACCNADTTTWERKDGPGIRYYCTGCEKQTRLMNPISVRKGETKQLLLDHLDKGCAYDVTGNCSDKENSGWLHCVCTVDEDQCGIHSVGYIGIEHNLGPMKIETNSQDSINSEDQSERDEEYAYHADPKLDTMLHMKRFINDEIAKRKQEIAREPMLRGKYTDITEDVGRSERRMGEKLSHIPSLPEGYDDLPIRKPVKDIVEAEDYEKRDRTNGW